MEAYFHSILLDEENDFMTTHIFFPCYTYYPHQSASAVARGWGDKMVVYLKLFDNYDDKNDNNNYGTSYYQLFIFALAPGHGLNFAAFLVSTGAVLLLLAGVKESKYVTNLVSSIKTMLILFIATLSLALMKTDNLIPYIPPEFGTAGIIRGATSSFFGYVGFDEICCLSGEAINPKKNVPQAIIITLLLVTTLYVSASLGLSGMVPYQEISEASAFPDGFRYRGYNIAADITAMGELAVLPLCVLVTIMAQPRLTYTMAMDGILPTLFAELDEKNNLFKGTIISGIVMIIIATVVPFIHLDDIISSGILIAFTLTNTSVILVRCASPKDKPYTLERLLIAFHLLSIISGLLIKELITINTIQGLILLSCIVSIIIVGYWIRKCPRVDETNVEFYLTPAVPILPLCGCFVNILLITRMEFGVLGFLSGYIGLALLGHYCTQKSNRTQLLAMD
jgi:APA family basic amino acid/polyamine antiporter